jgi:hypothetical protein
MSNDLRFTCLNYSVKNIVICAFALVLSCFSYGQTYKGTVVDSEKQPIAYANVIIQNSEGILITGTITDEQGKFEIVLKETQYPVTLEISFLGYNTWKKEFLSKANTDVGIITLKEDENQLGEIVISVKLPTIERKVDRLIFNVKNTIISSGGDAIDILKKTPGVRVNNDEIKLIGKSNLRVLINGRLSPLSGDDLNNFLRSVSSDEISTVEVITNPPAKYEAAGNSGLINIVLKKAKSDYFGGNIRTTYQQATFPTGFLNGSMTYQKNKWSFFLNANRGDGSVQVDEDNDIFYPTQQWNTDTKIRYFTNFITARAGIDYDFNDKTSIGIQYLGTDSNPNNSEKTTTTLFNNANAIDSLLITNADTELNTQFNSYNLHFKTELDTLGKSMAIDVDYFTYDYDSDRLNDTDTFLANGSLVPNSNELFNNTSTQNITNFTSRIDFEWPTKFAEVQFGGKVSFIKNYSDVAAFLFDGQDFILDANQSNEFEYRENIQAVYTSASKTVGKWDFQVGLRLERTQTEGNSITLNQINTNDYDNLFPTAYISYTPNDNHFWSLNYGRRINRPTYSNLNPFRWYSNPFSFTEGNPLLQPSFVHNVEFSNLYKDNLSTSIYFTSIQNGADQITLVDLNSNLQATVWKNFLDQTSIGLTQSYTFDKISWLESYFQYDLNYSRIESNSMNTITDQDGFNFYGSIDNSFIFNSDKTFLGEFNFWYSAPGVNGVDFLATTYSFDLGLKAMLLEKNFEISLSLSDIFRTQRDVITSIINNINQEYRNYYDTRRLRVSLKYQFGNSKLRSKRKRFSNEEERRRLD